ncbi:MAG: tyrosine recombinase XerC [Ruminococcus sp.]|nr:tyrosine recombinase XerC [Ruminococcus sp.]
MIKYNLPENPDFLNDYLVHLKLYKRLSQRTIEEYFFDTRLFLKYYLMMHSDSDDIIDDVDISTFPKSDLKKITATDISGFMIYISDERSNSYQALYRKISALRSFFRYLDKVAKLIETDPCKDLDDIHSPRAALPKFLSLDESLRLLKASDKSDSKRDYCIITIFLNCGIRLSELVGLNISDIDFYENRMKVLGKGNKERMIYLNSACVDALNKYLEVRQSNEKAASEPALFVSNQNKRISKRRVQQIVENTLQAAGLDGKGFTTHKLRHTAATLIYQYGDVDVLTLKELLGHASVATTQIYTHINNESVRNAVESNPLSDQKSKDKK